MTLARRGAERHSSDHRGLDPYDSPYDPWRDHGSHEAANLRDALRGPTVDQLNRRLSPHGRVLCGDTPIPCRLCTPSEGYVCSFHRDDDESAGNA